MNTSNDPLFAIDYAASFLDGVAYERLCEAKEAFTALVAAARKLALHWENTCREEEWDHEYADSYVATRAALANFPESK